MTSGSVREARPRYSASSPLVLGVVSVLVLVSGLGGVGDWAGWRACWVGWDEELAWCGCGGWVGELVGEFVVVGVCWKQQQRGATRGDATHYRTNRPSSGRRRARGRDLTKGSMPCICSSMCACAFLPFSTWGDGVGGWKDG